MTPKAVKPKDETCDITSWNNKQKSYGPVLSNHKRNIIAKTFTISTRAMTKYLLLTKGRVKIVT